MTRSRTTRWALLVATLILAGGYVAWRQHFLAAQIEQASSAQKARSGPPPVAVKIAPVFSQPLKTTQLSAGPMNAK